MPGNFQETSRRKAKVLDPPSRTQFSSKFAGIMRISSTPMHDAVHFLGE
jgi:hypothetical protein